jgi:hypothetical protein
VSHTSLSSVSHLAALCFTFFAERAFHDDPAGLQTWFSVRSEHGFTAVHKALQSGSMSGLRALLDFVWSAPMLDRDVLHALLTAPTKGGWTPLHSAAVSPNPECALHFLDRVANAGVGPDALCAAALARAGVFVCTPPIPHYVLVALLHLKNHCMSPSPPPSEIHHIQHNHNHPPTHSPRSL